MVDGLEAFLEKFKVAKNYNSREIRLTIIEAEQLSIAITNNLAKLNQLSTKVIELQDIILADKLSIEASGGSFSD
jgi:hypothetical protein